MATNAPIPGGSSEIPPVTPSRPIIPETPSEISASSNSLQPPPSSSDTDRIYIPSYSRWFSWNEINECEVRSLPEFFDSRSSSKNPRVYLYLRNSIIKQYRDEHPNKINFTDVRRTLVGDVVSIRRVFDFVDSWGLINYSSSASAKPLKWDDKEAVASEPPSTVKESAKRICNGCKSVCSVACFASEKYELTLCARCYVRGNYRVGINSSEFKRVELSEESKTGWSEKETLLLLEAVMHYGDDWKKVASHVTGRTEKDCVSQFVKLPFGEQFAKDSDSEDALETFDQIKGSADHESEGRVKDGSSSPDNKRMKLTPLADASNPIMAQAAFLSALAGTKVAEAAARAAVTALSDIDHEAGKNAVSAKRASFFCLFDSDRTMSGSETGLTAANREPMPFTMSLHHQQHNQPPPPPQPQQNSQNMQLSFTGADRTAVYKPMSSDSSPQQQYQHNSETGLNMNVPVMGGEQRVKKRRGRPRKYEPGSGEASLGFVPGPPSYTVSQPSGGDGGGGGASPTVKRMRGRPSGSSNRPKLQALGSTGVGFTPHVLTVNTGEDVSSKIMAFSQNGPRAVCVLSANGAISNVTLRQAATSGGTVTYEGRFEILSLSGSFLLLENNGHRSRTGGLSVSLSAPDGNVLGGCVAGLLIAASPVQIVVGSFIPDGQKEHVGHMELASPALPRVTPSHVLTTPNSQQARGGMSESSCGGHGSPLQQTAGGPYNNNNLSMPWK
ncbi:unnamed protein product [Brassica rapa subsp. narinosa]